MDKINGKELGSSMPPRDVHVFVNTPTAIWHFNNQSYLVYNSWFVLNIRHYLQRTLPDSDLLGIKATKTLLTIWNRLPDGVTDTFSWILDLRRWRR